MAVPDKPFLPEAKENVIVAALPVALLRRLEDFCRIEKEGFDNVLADALELHLDSFSRVAEDDEEAAQAVPS